MFACPFAVSACFRMVWHIGISVEFLFQLICYIVFLYDSRDGRTAPQSCYDNRVTGLLRTCLIFGLGTGGATVARITMCPPSRPVDASLPQTRETPWPRLRAFATCSTAWVSTTERSSPCLARTHSAGRLAWGLSRRC